MVFPLALIEGNAVHDEKQENGLQELLLIRSKF